METNQKAGMAGLPDDAAVGNNKGRAGAAGGPAAFREFFRKLKGPYPITEMVEDHGDHEVVKGNIAASHGNAAELITQIQKQYNCSLIIGGGHDYAFPHLAGVRDAHSSQTIGCINLDPHFDLRPPEPVILSGSPFFMAIENGIIDGGHLVEFGIQHHCNADFLWDYASEQKIETFTFDQLRFGQSVEKFQTALNQLAIKVDHIVISLDLDSVQAAYAPGVSAPAPEGFQPSEIMEMTSMAANHPKVVSLGIYELNPFFDMDHHTARLAAMVAFNFLRVKFTT